MIRTISIVFPLLALSPLEVSDEKWEIFDFIIEKGGKEAYRLPEKGAKKKNLFTERGIKYEKFITPDKTQCGVRSVSPNPYGFFAVPTKTTTKIGIWSKDDFRKPDLQYQFNMYNKKTPKTKYYDAAPKNSYLILGFPYFMATANTYDEKAFYLFHADYRRSIASPSIGRGDVYHAYEISYETAELSEEALSKMLNGVNISFLYASRSACKNLLTDKAMLTISQPDSNSICFSNNTVLATFKPDGEFNKKIEHCRKQRSNRF